MEGRGNLIAAILVIIVVLAVVLGTILYLTQSLGGKFNLFSNFPKFTTTNIIPSITPKVSISPAPTIFPKTSANPKPTAVNIPTNTGSGKSVYSAAGFQLQYPSTWGVLSCTNSQNFELDPYKSSNQKISCNSAVKPITILVDQGISCKGDLVKLGSHQVYKSKIQYRDWLTNEYCFNKVGKNIDITNRVSNSGAIGTGKDDFATQIEQIISTISFQ